MPLRLGFSVYPLQYLKIQTSFSIALCGTCCLCVFPENCSSKSNRNIHIVHNLFLESLVFCLPDITYKPRLVHFYTSFQPLLYCKKKKYATHISNQVEAENHANKSKFLQFAFLIISKQNSSHSLTKFSVEAHKVRHNIIWPIRGFGSVC